MQQKTFTQSAGALTIKPGICSTLKEMLRGRKQTQSPELGLLESVLVS